ncbi:MAG TPA: response regulator [Planctomycetaceae bacterium]|nr:response regulator [Planctomycetaceae bacterium]
MRKRILVIDDDPLFRSLIVALLRKDYLVSVASEGAEGFYKALEHAPDLAVVDVQMPGWDGLKTLKNFRSHPALETTPIVMLTSDASKETVLAAINGGADDYVIKTSFSKAEFLQKLEKHLPPDPTPAVTEAEARADSQSHPAGPHANGPAETDARLQEIIDDWE